MRGKSIANAPPPWLNPMRNRRMALERSAGDERRDAERDVARKRDDLLLRGRSHQPVAAGGMQRVHEDRRAEPFGGGEERQRSAGRRSTRR